MTAISPSTRRERGQDTAEDNQSNRDNAERAYNLIMKDKEKLLGFETKLKFIFSHSALREGWDNPNVFQICAMREMGTERERRQTIGRGLRLCVNQKGERLRGFDINTLTVIATESYEEFAENLQKEIEDDTGIRFGVVEKHQFAAIPVADDRRRGKTAGRDTIGSHLDTSERGGLCWTPRARCRTPCARRSKDETLHLARGRSGSQTSAGAARSAENSAGQLDIKNADERKQIKTRQAVVQSAEFKAFGTESSTRRPIAFSSITRSLIDCCIQGHQGMPAHHEDPPAMAQGRLGDWQGRHRHRGNRGIAAPIVLEEQDIELPDLLTELQDKTQLTRRSLVRILTDSERLDDFKKNPQQFIDLVADPSIAPSGWPWSMASNTSVSATSTITPRSFSSRKS